MGDVWTVRGRNWLLLGSVLMMVGVILSTSGYIVIYWTEMDWEWGMRGVSIVWIISAWLNVTGMLLILWSIFHRR